MRETSTGLTDVDDGDLVIDAVWGRAKAFAEIYDRYGDEIHDLCWTCLRDRDAAAAVTPRAFVTSAGLLHQLRDPADLRGWLRGVTRDLLDGRTPDPSPDGDSVALPEADGAAVTLDTHMALRELLWDPADGLTDVDRRMLALHLGEGLEGHELGRAVGMDAARSDVALARLRDRVEHTLGAVLVAGLGPASCPQLARHLQVGSWPPPAAMRQRLRRHVDRCAVCRSGRAAIGPWTLLREVPIAFAPAALRDAVVADMVAAVAAGREPAFDNDATNGPVSDTRPVAPNRSVRSGTSRTAVALLVAAGVAGGAVIGVSDAVWVRAFRQELAGVRDKIAAVVDPSSEGQDPPESDAGTPDGPGVVPGGPIVEGDGGGPAAGDGAVLPPLLVEGPDGGFTPAQPLGGAAGSPLTPPTAQFVALPGTVPAVVSGDRGGSTPERSIAGTPSPWRDPASPQPSGAGAPAVVTPTPEGPSGPAVVARTPQAPVVPVFGSGVTAPVRVPFRPATSTPTPFLVRTPSGAPTPSSVRTPSRAATPVPQRAPAASTGSVTGPVDQPASRTVAALPSRPARSAAIPSGGASPAGAAAGEAPAAAVVPTPQATTSRIGTALVSDDLVSSPGPAAEDAAASELSTSSAAPAAGRLDEPTADSAAPPPASTADAPTSTVTAVTGAPEIETGDVSVSGVAAPEGDTPLDMTPQLEAAAGSVSTETVEADVPADAVPTTPEPLVRDLTSAETTPDDGQTAPTTPGAPGTAARTATQDSAEVKPAVDDAVEAVGDATEAAKDSTEAVDASLEAVEDSAAAGDDTTEAVTDSAQPPDDDPGIAPAPSELSVETPDASRAAADAVAAPDTAESSEQPSEQQSALAVVLSLFAPLMARRR